MVVPAWPRRENFVAMAQSATFDVCVFSPFAINEVHGLAVLSKTDLSVLNRNRSISFLLGIINWD